MVILNGATPVASGDPATWSAGVNHVKVTVSVAGEDDGVYHIDVTKS